MTLSDVQVYAALVIALIPFYWMYRLGIELYK
ncbi:MAG: photosystem I reaction center subunit XII [Hormoscilla sp.]